MTDIYPLTFQWDGEVMIPLNPRRAELQYTVGETYRLVPNEDRSLTSHNHYFAALGEAFKSLPHEAEDHYPTVEHLRKRALIKAGYRNERTIVCATPLEATKVAAFIQPLDDLAYVISRGNMVAVYTAKSQKESAMGKADFQKSKDDVLRIVAELIGVTTDELAKNAGQSA